MTAIISPLPPTVKVRASPLKPPAGSLEQPVANCSSSDFSSLARERTTDQNHPLRTADGPPLNDVCLAFSLFRPSVGGVDRCTEKKNENEKKKNEHENEIKIKIKQQK